MNPCCIARRQITVSMDPDAEVVCPVKDLVLDIAGIVAPNTLCRARLSVMSLFGVPVP